VIDLASGTGEPAITLASRVGPQGHVTAIDLSADLLEIAEKRAHSRALTNFSTHKTDAHALPFANDSFDLGTSRFGVMFFRDPQKALGELRRVLRPGARACFLAWGSFDQPYWSSTVGTVHQLIGGPLLPPDERIHFDSRALAACRPCCGQPVSSPSKNRHELYRGPGQVLPRKFGSR
jgi:ubiquinone/menaquinone biosynthesis C-methylase UbiE